MNLAWKQFEQLCIYRLRKDGGWIRRAGVTGAQLIGRPELNKDRVDFVGEADGIPFKFDCKTCSQSCLDIGPGQDMKPGQYDELKAFAGVAFLLIHFNPRRLAQVTTDAATYAFPMHCDFWWGYERGFTKSINQMDCAHYAVSVAWNAAKGCKKASPDIVRAVKELRAT